MVKKSEQKNHEILSRSHKKLRKPIYKKSWFWIIMILGVILGTIGICLAGSEDGAVEEPIKQSLEENSEISELEEVESSEETSEVVNTEEESLYTYVDFKGTYVAFEGEPYNSPIDSMSSDIVVLEDNFYQTFNRWDYDMSSTILEKTIEDNLLTLRLDSDQQEEWGLHSESGSEQFELSFDGGKGILRPSSTDAALYSMASKDLQTHYDQLEIDYARIIMTIMGKPSLDAWALWETENDIPIIRIRYSSAGDSVIFREGVTYPEGVTHIDLTHQGADYGVITYSTIGDGNIRKYYTPSQLYQDEQALQDVINNPDTIYVEPFEPYDVADFIGRVEFVY